MLKPHSNGAIAMAMFVFVLTAVPKLNIRVGRFRSISLILLLF